MPSGHPAAQQAPPQDNETRRVLLPIARHAREALTGDQRDPLTAISIIHTLTTDEILRRISQP